MRGVTHTWAALTTATTISAYFVVDIPTAVFGTALALTAGSLPDMLTAIVPFVKVKTFEGHRGFSHWLLAAFASTYLIYLWRPGLWMYWLAAYLSHLLLDLITTTGLYIFGPIPVTVRLGRCRNGGLVDQLLERLLPWSSATLVVIWLYMLLTGTQP